MHLFHHGFALDFRSSETGKSISFNADVCPDGDMAFAGYRSERNPRLHDRNVVLETCRGQIENDLDNRNLSRGTHMHMVLAHYSFSVLHRSAEKIYGLTGDFGSEDNDLADEIRAALETKHD